MKFSIIVVTAEYEKNPDYAEIQLLFPETEKCSRRLLSS